MNLIDTNTVNDIFDHDTRLKGIYYLPPDVLVEANLASEIRGRQLPSKIRPIEESDLFRLGMYLARYKLMLNKHGGKSFFNMTGFGDISILAATRTILDVFEQEQIEQTRLFNEPIIVITRDAGLTKRLLSEFSNEDIEIKETI